MNNDEIVNPELIKDLDLSHFLTKEVKDECDFTPIVVLKKSTYTQAHKEAQQRYREKYPEKYCESQRKLYERKKDDPEWKAKFNERCKANNALYRQKKKEEKEALGVVTKPRGRPRKLTIDKMP
jgi:hypothetical protein